MDNHSISKHFSFLSKLMDVHGENSFKSKTYSITAYKIDQLTEELQTQSDDKIFSINGIGDAIGKKIIELNANGSMKILDDLVAKTPAGILEMMKLKGLGPKKMAIIWRELEIETIGELLYACHENKLELTKGFGKKTQQNVIDSIEFYQAHQGNFLYAQVEKLSEELHEFFTRIFHTKNIFTVGGIATHEITIDEIAFVIAKPLPEIISVIKSRGEFVEVEQSNDFITYGYNSGIKIKLYSTTEDQAMQTVLEKTADEQFLKSFKGIIDKKKIDLSTFRREEEIFTKAGLSYIPAYMRKGNEVIERASSGNLPETINPEDIRGIIHCHSNWSDGSNTLEELASACIERGLEYLVISDHSKSASYAQGLTEDRVKAQHALVDELNAKLSPFKIFKSIESDILNDGSLDYSAGILSTFDLVIASVHSNLKMPEEKAMTRLTNAIQNPFTTILGHMTGRLLLSRKGFPVDHKKIIDLCAEHQVVIEINAHPRRLDMHWEFIGYALERNVMQSIDPDAHSIPEFDNVRYGVLAAQKGLLPKEKNLSSFL